MTNQYVFIFTYIKVIETIQRLAYGVKGVTGATRTYNREAGTSATVKC
jgi:hypothetical protein